jgi:hypothetical protein
MEALSAWRYNPTLKTFHKRLAAGKKPEVILVAVMRTRGVGVGPDRRAVTRCPR